MPIAKCQGFFCDGFVTRLGLYDDGCIGTNAPPFLPEARKQRAVFIVRFISRGDSPTDVVLQHAGAGAGVFIIAVAVR